MKQILTLFLSLSMVFSLTACGGGNSGEDAGAATSSESAQSGSTQEEASGGESGSSPAETSGGARSGSVAQNEQEEAKADVLEWLDGLGL